jgi:hypothetical protein
MRTSREIKNIATAMLQAQKEMKVASKDSANPFFHSSYADINSILEACVEALNGSGISILQPVMGDFVQTILMHESGEWFMGKTRIVNAKPNDPQAQGSAITYARRYGLQSMLGMMATDDDGEGAMNRKKEASKRATSTPESIGISKGSENPPGTYVYATEKQVALIERLVTQKMLPDQWLEKKGLESFDKIRFVDVNKYLAELQ